MRILCEVYTKLTAMIIQHWILLVGCWLYADRSLTKAAQVVRDHTVSLILAFSSRRDFITVLNPTATLSQPPRYACPFAQEREPWTHRLAEELLTDLTARESEHGMKLRTVRDRLEEHFVQPLRVDQACARVPRAAAARRDGQPEDNTAFQGLLAAIRPLAESPVGVGLDVPAWVRRLEDELRKVKLMDPDDEADEPTPSTNDEYPLPPHAGIDLDDFRRQIRDWDSPIGE